MVSQPINGIIPFETNGFPNGAGSAKEAVMAQIKNDNAAQNDINQNFLNLVVLIFFVNYISLHHNPI